MSGARHGLNLRLASCLQAVEGHERGRRASELAGLRARRFARTDRDDLIAGGGHFSRSPHWPVGTYRAFCLQRNQTCIKRPWAAWSLPSPAWRPTVIRGARSKRLIFHLALDDQAQADPIARGQRISAAGKFAPQNRGQVEAHK